MSFEQGRESLDVVATPKAPSSGRTNSDVTPPAIVTPSGAAASSFSPVDGDLRAKLDNVLQSDIGINTLLTRLKQSISSAQDFSSFLRERSLLEEKNAQGLKRLTRSTHDIIRRPESRQGSFASSYEEINRIQERMADNGLHFANSLHTMAEELQDLAAHAERGRKHWKHTGLSAEKRVQDAEMAMEKAKGKYYTTGDQYERARTGERQGGKFGLMGTKSAAQQEESLKEKVDMLDSEYASRVDSARSSRQELVATHRPQAVKALQDIIAECDAGLTMQLQKFAALNERLLIGNGLCVSPLKNQSNGVAGGSRSLREVVQGVDNHQDFHDYVLSFTNKAGSVPPEIKYERHPALMMPKQSIPTQPMHSSYNVSDSPYGTPNRTNTGTNDLHNRNTSGQISGVTPYQSGNRDGLSGNSPYSYNTGASSQSPSYNTGAPQLPQIGALGTVSRQSLDTKRPDGTSSTGPDYGQRNVSGISQSRPDNVRHGRSVNQSVTLGDGYVSQSSPDKDHFPSTGSTFNDNHGPNAGRGGTYNDGRNLPAGRGQLPSSMGQVNNGRGGSMPGTSPYNDSRGAGPVGGSPFNDGRGPGGVRSGSTGDQRGPNQQYPPENRTPGLGQTGDYRADNRGPVQDPNSRPYQEDGRSLPSQASSYNPQGGHAGPTGSIGSGMALGAGAGAGAGVMGAITANKRQDAGRPSLPPLKPVFGVSLEELFQRDGSAVPTIVYQCVQAVDLFGLNVEGIYRTSGSAPHIMQLKALFDHDSSQVDFRTPTAFHNDIASVTTLLKHFLRDLPDPLLTGSQYPSFIAAAKIEDDIVRRDSLHAIINSLPDPNYATLRVLTLHLYRVSQHSSQNRMTPSNIAICFGPTLLGGQGGGPAGADIKDAGWQARVVETILNNTFQIFDDDE